MAGGDPRVRKGPGDRGGAAARPRDGDRLLPDGARWKCRRSGTVTTIESGTIFEVLGPVRRRGWIVGLTEPTLYPDARPD